MGTKTGNLLKAIVAELARFAKVSLDVHDALLKSMGSVRILARNMKMLDNNYYSAMQGLERSGYIKRVENNQLLITPKGIKRARRLMVENPEKNRRENWDGFWRIIIFDLPNDLTGKRNIFRSAIKRNGFIGLQKSVYVFPYADFEELAYLRDELKIEKYVTFLIAKVPPTDNDELLRKRFKL